MKKIKSALVSVFHKEGLEPIIEKMIELDIKIYSTGGTQKFIEGLGGQVNPVEELTGYPSILGGRVKTLHPKVFGGILARREADHLGQLDQYDIPTIDLVVVDLYPFEATVASTTDEEAIIEKIDIGGIALIRGAAKNFNDVAIVPAQSSYGMLQDILDNQGGATTLEQRTQLAAEAFAVSSHYDSAIFNYFNKTQQLDHFRRSHTSGKVLRYGENPHQSASYYGDLNEMLEQLSGKELSFNNLVDIDAAVGLMKEFKDEKPAFAILKHTNPCGVAIRSTVLKSWHAALAGDPVSAFGGILISNHIVDLATAEEIDKLFYEVLIAPGFDSDAQALLTKKSKRVLLKIKHWNIQAKSFKSLLNGTIVQDTDLSIETEHQMTVATKAIPNGAQMDDLLFASKCAKHLKSNTIVLARGNQLLGMGCGQTSRVDALKQAITKAKHFGFELEGSVMASDAFFPFPDCVEIADQAGIKAVIQPGGSIKDQLSIDYCDANGLAMVMTGVRHFKH